MMQEAPLRYTFSAFLKDRGAFLVATLGLEVFLSSVLMILAVSLSGIIFIDLIVLVGAAIYLAYEYSRDARFWSALIETANMIDKSTYFADLIEEPRTLQGCMAYEATTALAQASNDELFSLQKTVKDHSQYIELWVHEAKTPLAAARLVAKRMQGQDAHILSSELERIGDLIDQSLFSARLGSLDRDYLIREVSLADVVKGACKSHMHYLISLDVSLDFAIDESIKVFTDKTWLEFIITQVVINSAKYEAKTITFTAKPPVSESAEANTVLEIKDDGCGIPASDVPRVFDRGFTGEVGRAHSSATGMGLYLVACMCESMGLSITLASEEGIGTRVLIAFPHDKRRMRLATANLSTRHPLPIDAGERRSEAESDGRSAPSCGDNDDADRMMTCAPNLTNT